MEQKTKFQYSYFIYPYVIGAEKYEKYLARLLKKPNCKLKLFEKEKDYDIYRFFLPKVRDYLFWSFGIPKGKIKDLYDLPEDTSIKEQAKDLYHKLENLDFNFDAESVGNFFTRIIDAIVGFFQDLFS